MKKVRMINAIKVNLAIISLTSSAQSTNVDTQQTMQIKKDTTYTNHFPRIEMYVANSDSKQKPLPFVDKTTYLIENKDAFKQTNLKFLPDFQEEKNDITLMHYFEMYKLNNLTQRTSLFPRSLDAYHKQKSKTNHKTIIDYETRLPHKVEIVWLDKETWYVNNVFHHLDLQPLKNSAVKTISEPRFIESEMRDFLAFSFVIQQNIDERIRYLRIHSPTNQDFVKDKVILRVEKTPGGPGSHSYAYTVYADGRITTPGNTYYTPSYKLAHHQLIEVRNKIQPINFDKLSNDKNSFKPKPHLKDGQTKSLDAFHNGKHTSLSYQIGDEVVPVEVANFHTYFLNLIETLNN